ncbi:MAG: hypothetical protein K8R06_00450, partial [Methanosarcinales archaeon]|nr:hypothetical protein [Methanosarcinales archaeon]
TLQLTTVSNVSHSVVSATPIPLKTVCPTQTPTPTPAPQVPAEDGLDVPGFPIPSGILAVFTIAVLLKK